MAFSYERGTHVAPYRRPTTRVKQWSCERGGRCWHSRYQIPVPHPALHSPFFRIPCRQPQPPLQRHCLHSWALSMSRTSLCLAFAMESTMQGAGARSEKRARMRERERERERERDKEKYRHIDEQRERQRARASAREPKRERERERKKERQEERRTERGTATESECEGEMYVCAGQRHPKPQTPNPKP